MPTGRFDNYEKTRDEFAQKQQVSQFERWSSPHTHPGASIFRILIVKSRVLSMFIIRRLNQGSGRRAALSDMRKLTGAAQGKTVLVIGSGPSAERLNPHAVTAAQNASELVVIATNHFLASPLATTITPDYLVWSDDGFHPRHRHTNSARWELLAKNSEVVLVAPWTWKRELEKVGAPNHTTYFDDDSLETWSKNISPLKPRGYQGTTGAKALALAVHLRPQRTEVIGVDLSYIKNFSVGPDNQITRHPTHLTGTDSGQQNLTSYTLSGMADLLYSTANHFRAFHTHFSGHNIWNLDPHSLVDAFPKVTHSPFTT